MTANCTFTPPWSLRNPHVQSILNSVGPRKIRAKRLARKLCSQQLILTASDGTRLKAEFDRSDSGKNALVILLHGWEGSSQSAYTVTTANYLLKHGYHVLRLNMRDHGDTQHLNYGLFNSTLTPEVADVIAAFTAQHTFSKIFLAGFSLGGNFTLRIAADSGQDLNLTAAVAICPPIDPVNAMTALDNAPVIYEKYFFKRWSTSLRKKLEHFPEYDFADDLNRARCLSDMNTLFIYRYTPFDDVDTYFRSYALTGSRLANLRVPTHLIASADDPILPVTDIARIDSNESLSIDIQPYGGHCGFIKNLAGHSWIEPKLVELFDRYL